jgi:hypothetical protein
MAFEKLPDIPFFLKQSDAAIALGISLPELRVLIHSGELRLFGGSGGPRIGTESVCLYLGKEELRNRWPLVVEKKDRP